MPVGHMLGFHTRAVITLMSVMNMTFADSCSPNIMLLHWTLLPRSTKILSGIITVYGLYCNPLWLRCFFPSLSLAASPDCGRAPEAVGLRADGSTVAKLGGKAKGFAGMVADDVTVHSRAHCSPKL